MKEQINKLDSSRFEIVREPVLADPIIETYSIDELKARELTILESINNFVENKKKELETVRDLISKAENLGLKTQEVILAEKVIEENTKAEEIINETP